MSIQTEVLNRWTNQGSIENSSRTYSSVENAIKNERYGLDRDDFEHNYEIHLQGSYANYTNIHGTSDVDIVVRITMPFEENLEELSYEEKRRFWNKYSDISYEWEDFHNRVHRALRGYFGRENLEVGDKAIKVKNGEGSPIPKSADVVACADYRKYRAVSADDDEEYVTGMYFKTQSTNRPIVNYSKRHRENGTNKNQSTEGNYKRTVRMFKNAKETAIDRGHITDDVVTSYFLEGLTYNVPNSKYLESDLQDRYIDILDWLSQANINEFPEQSEMYPLCEQSDPDRWSEPHAERTIRGLYDLWENY